MLGTCTFFLVANYATTKIVGSTRRSRTNWQQVFVDSAWVGRRVRKCAQQNQWAQKGRAKTFEAVANGSVEGFGKGTLGTGLRDGDPNAHVGKDRGRCACQADDKK